jgi:hypothetical protein
VKKLIATPKKPSKYIFQFTFLTPKCNNQLKLTLISDDSILSRKTRVNSALSGPHASLITFSLHSMYFLKALRLKEEILTHHP